jgi:RNA polymerase sigma-70 factor (ECF subfamily)
VSDDLAELVAAAKDGDRAAFDEVVRATYAEAYTLAYRLTGDEEDAKDVVQEAYLRAYKGLKRFRGDAAFSTWLYRITANCASTQVVRRARDRHEDLDDGREVTDTRPEIDPEARVDATLLRERLQGALEALPPRLRAVVVLRDVYDLSHGAIAAELGITESAAKVRLHRARRRLRDQLFPPRGAEGGEGDAHAV